MFFTAFPLLMPKSDSFPSIFAPFFKATLPICFCCFLQKSDCERIAPVAHYKKETMSNSLLLFFTKEQWE